MSPFREIYHLFRPWMIGGAFVLLTSSCGIKMHVDGIGLGSEESIENQAPEFGFFVINEISPSNNDPIQLTYGPLYGGAYTEYCILENSDNSADCSWVAGVVPTVHSPAVVDGTLRLSLFTRNGIGATSRAVNSNVVSLDRVPPVLASAAVTNSSPTTSLTYSLTFGAVTGTYSSYCILENDTDSANCSWSPSTLPSAFGVTAVDGMKTLSVWLRDPAGNISARVDTSPVELDRTAPSLASVTITNSNPSASTTYLLSYGAVSGAYTQYCIRENNTSSTGCAWVVGALPASYTVSATENAKTLSVWLRDGAGNTSARVGSNTVTLDTTAPSVSLLSLTGGQTVGGGSTVSINWSASDANFGATPIGIFVSSDGGASYSSLSANESNDGSYSWSVPVVNSTTYRVRVVATDAAGNSSLASSTSTFTINSSSPVVSVLSPNGGEAWAAGSVQTVTWTSSGLPGGASSARIEYSLDGGATFSLIATGEVNDGSYSWTMPVLAPGNSDTRIRVIVTDSLAVNTQDDSDSNFAIDGADPVITLGAPVGGESYRGGDAVSITWTASDAHDGGGLGTNPIRLEYSDNSGASWNLIADSLANSGSYSWTLPSVTSKTFRVRARVTDRVGRTNLNASASDFWVNSSTPVIAVTAPNGGQLLSGGAVLNVTWSSTGLPAGTSTASIDYSTDLGTSWVNLHAAIPNSGSYATTVPSVNSSQVLYRVRVLDSFNVETSDSSDSSLSIDSTAPVVALVSPQAAVVRGAGKATSITWTASDTNFGANPIRLEYSANAGGSWSTIVASTTNSGSYPWTVPVVADGSQLRIRVTATDAVGRTTSSTGTDFRVDNAGPSFVAGQFTLQGSATPPSTRSTQVTVGFSATDTWSPIQFACFKLNATAPGANDTCWTSVSAMGATPSTSLTVSAGIAQLDFVPNPYTVYAWVKDASGFISALSPVGAGTAGLDRGSIVYDPGTPAVVESIVVSSTDTPSAPPSQSDLTLPSGSTVYVRWKATDDEVIPAGAVTIYYTEDEQNFQVLGSGLSNSANGGCTLTGDYTGCARLVGASPTSGYFRVRVAITDSDGYVTFSSSQFLNTGAFSLIAGNTERGIGGSARSAYYAVDLGGSSFSDKKSLVVTNNGTIYVIDRVLGILKIDPNVQIASVFVQQTGASTGDGGAITSATLRDASMIALDYSNRLLVWDYDRVRRIDLNQNPPTISTIFGGGALTADSVAGTDLLLPSSSQATKLHASRGSLVTFEVLPNDDVLFNTEINSRLLATGTTGGFRYRRFSASTGNVTSVYLSGTGAQGNASRDLSLSRVLRVGFTFDPITGVLDRGVATIALENSGSYSSYAGVSFDPVTGVSVGSGTHIPDPGTAYNDDFHFMTGRDGRLYNFSGSRHGYVRVYIPDTNSWSTISAIGGAAGAGYCADETLFTSCALRLEDIFVTSGGTMFLVDNNQIRVINSSSRIKTIYGQTPYENSGLNALAGRFLGATWFGRRDTGQIVVYDEPAAQIFEFSPGGNLSHIAGNSRETTGNYFGADAKTQPMPAGGFFPSLDSATGDLYIRGGNPRGIVRLNRSTGGWSMWRGSLAGGVNCYQDPSADSSSSVKFDGTSGAYSCNSTNQIMNGIAGGQLLVTAYQGINPTNRDLFAKFYSLSTGQQTHFVGALGDFMHSGVNAICAAGTTVASCDRIPHSGASQEYTYDPGNNQWIIAARIGRTLRAYPIGGTVANYQTLAVGREIGGYTVRFGATPTVYFCDQPTGKIYRQVVGGAESELPFGTSTVRCSGRSVVWDEAAKKVLFTVTQNGLAAVAEYYDP